MKNDLRRLAGVLTESKQEVNEEFNEDKELFLEFFEMIYDDSRTKKIEKLFEEKPWSDLYQYEPREGVSPRTMINLYTDRINPLVSNTMGDLLKQFPDMKQDVALRLAQQAAEQGGQAAATLSSRVQNFIDANGAQALTKINSGDVGIGKLLGSSTVSMNAAPASWFESLGSGITGGLSKAGSAVDSFIKTNLPDIASSSAYQSASAGAGNVLTNMASNPSFVAAGAGLAALLILAPKLFKGFRKWRAKRLLKKINARRAARNLPPIPAQALQDPKGFIERAKTGELG